MKADTSKGMSSQDATKVLALHGLHGDEEAVFDLSEVVDLHDVWVGKFDTELGFIDKHLDEVFVAGELTQNPLYDDNLLKAGVAEALGTKDLGHAAYCDLVEQEVLAKPHRLKGARCTLRAGACAQTASS